MQSPSLFPRTFGKRSSFKGAYKSRMLNIFKLQTLLKLHLERSFQACGVDMKVATTRRFVATYIHRVYPGRDSPPVYRESRQLGGLSRPIYTVYIRVATVHRFIATYLQDINCILNVALNHFVFFGVLRSSGPSALVCY